VTTSEQIRLTAYSHGGGCACKLGTLELAELLGHVRTTTTDPAVLVGLETPDDAAVYKLTPDLAMVQTVDFFTPIVDDPYVWGRIAATNALSDIYAMGARPVTALNLVGWPRSLDMTLLGRVLEGGNDACEAAAVSIVGGHSIDDPEPKFGMAVTGLVHPDRVVTKNDVGPDRDLILTKPLGMGIISSGIKAGRTSAGTARAAEAVMMTLNKDAAEAMLDVGVVAATDVTGFGLIGHLRGMLAADTVARLDFGSIPMLEEAIQLARDGVLPGGSRRNLEADERFVDPGDLPDERRLTLFDAQTSGGLLIAIAPDRTETLLDRLQGGGNEWASVIGRTAEGSARVVVR
jgi:selenide,water dikinase